MTYLEKWHKKQKNVIVTKSKILQQQNLLYLSLLAIAPKIKIKVLLKLSLGIFFEKIIDPKL